VTLDRLAADRLRSIIEPFGMDGTGVSITIEDGGGHVLVVAGDPGADARPVEVRHLIGVAGEVIGAVVGRGAVDGRLMDAVVRTVAASIGALVEASLVVDTHTDAARVADAAAVRIEAELTLGRRIQRSFIPLASPRIPGYEIASHYEAAREVGGDFFDVFRIRGHRGRLAICIADVTGKGIAAALLMAFARPLLHAALDHAAAPGPALERTNRILVEERYSSLFITALCATVRLRTGHVQLANAGHEPPLVVPADGGPITWLEGSGPLLGAFANIELAECSTVLAPGDLVLLYTDGVTDARAPGGERFGDDRLVNALDASRDGTAADVVEAVCDAYHRFQADEPAADDVTLVAIRRAPRRR
jgi:sigma-B regulation protein RsbU (phosphoserine phosphatase)